METETNVCPTCGPTATEEHPRQPGVTRCANCKEWLHRAMHRADRPELTDCKPGLTRMNPWVACTGSPGGHHVRPCPQHHPWIYSRTAPRRWKHRQAVTA